MRCPHDVARQSTVTWTSPAAEAIT